MKPVYANHQSVSGWPSEWSAKTLIHQSYPKSGYSVAAITSTLLLAGSYAESTGLVEADGTISTRDLVGYTDKYMDAKCFYSYQFPLAASFKAIASKLPHKLDVSARNRVRFEAGVKELIAAINTNGDAVISEQEMGQFLTAPSTPAVSNIRFQLSGGRER